MGRRRFLKTLAGFGVSATSLNYITQDAIAKITENPKEEVPYVELLRHTNHDEIGDGTAPKREPIWDTIRRSRWVRVRSAHNAAKELNKNLREEFGTHHIAAGVTSRNGDPHQKEIVVDYTTVEHADGSTSSPSIPFVDVENVLPSTVSGQAGTGKNAEIIEDIPVRIRNFTKVETACPGDVYEYDYDPIPGGCETESGTCCTPAVDGNSNDVMIHCAHVKENEDFLSQPHESYGKDLKKENMATSDSNDNAYYQTYDGSSVHWRLADDDGTRKAPEIYGIVSWETLENKEGTDYTIIKQGNKDGDDTGTIKNTKINDGVKNVWTTCKSASGDSGGPAYHEVYNSSLNRYEAYIAYINSWTSSNSDGECPGDDSGGNAIEYVEDLWTLTV